jgi:hypothetical protein
VSNTAKINIAFNQPSRATEVITTTVPGSGAEDPVVVSRSVGGGAGTPGATGATGATGPAGPAGLTVEIFDAGETLGGNRAVKVHSDNRAYYVSASTPTDIGKACGITTGATTIGSSATIQRFGLMTEPSWTWVPGPVYVGVNGALTQTPPASGFVQAIGEAITATSLFIQPWPAIQLAA